MHDKARVEAIRRLNDALRCQGIGGRIMVTSGIQALGEEMTMRIRKAVSSFNSFTDDNDPHGEHDCAMLILDGINVLWKIDYYDLQLKYHSPDAADPAVTRRVLTIMFAEDY